MTLGGPQSRYGRYEYQNIFPLSGIDLRFLHFAAVAIKTVIKI
jgi:hypothetical protein